MDKLLGGAWRLEFMNRAWTLPKSIDNGGFQWGKTTGNGKPLVYERETKTTRQVLKAVEESISDPTTNSGGEKLGREKLAAVVGVAKSVFQSKDLESAAKYYRTWTQAAYDKAYKEWQQKPLLSSPPLDREAAKGAFESAYHTAIEGKKNPTTYVDSLQEQLWDAIKAIN